MPGWWVKPPLAAACLVAASRHALSRGRCPNWCWRLHPPMLAHAAQGLSPPGESPQQNRCCSGRAARHHGTRVVGEVLVEVWELPQKWCWGQGMESESGKCRTFASFCFDCCDL